MSLSVLARGIVQGFGKPQRTGRERDAGGHDVVPKLDRMGLLNPDKNVLVSYVFTGLAWDRAREVAIPARTPQYCVYCEHLRDLHFCWPDYPGGAGQCAFWAKEQDKLFFADMVGFRDSCVCWGPAKTMPWHLSKSELLRREGLLPPWYQVFDDEAGFERIAPLCSEPHRSGARDDVPDRGKFFAELLGLTDEDDQVDVRNCPEVREANQLVAQGDRASAIKRFRKLRASHPDSGNICALYAQALWAPGWEQRLTPEAVSLLESAFAHVRPKSIVAWALGQINLFEGNFIDAVTWCIRAVVLESRRSQPSSKTAYLASLYGNAAVVRLDYELDRAGRWLARYTNLTLDKATRVQVHSLARSYCDDEVADFMREAAFTYGWGVQAADA